MDFFVKSVNYFITGNFCLLTRIALQCRHDGYRIAQLIIRLRFYGSECALPLQWRHNGRDGVSNHQPHDCLLNRLFRRRSKKTSKLRITGLCAVNSPVTGEFPSQMASNAENVSICWRHHDRGARPRVHDPRDPFNWQRLTQNRAWISNLYMYHLVCYVIIHPCLASNVAKSLLIISMIELLHSKNVWL